MIHNKRNDVGDRVRELRYKLELTREELAEECGISVQTIKEIEKGTRNFMVSTLAVLSEGLNVSADYLLGINADKPSDAELRLQHLLHGISEDDVNYLIASIKLYRQHHTRQ